MKTEKEILLAVATAQEWDCWLNKMADEHAYPKFRDTKDCLFCRTFHACRYCKRNSRGCDDFGDHIRVDAAIARLEAAGVFEEEEEESDAIL